MRLFWAAAPLLLSACAAVATGPVWTATRTTDPITSQTKCVVAAADQGFGLYYTRTAYLYPIVEQSSQYGLLVGVSSGGTIRLPVGDVYWRVDNKPFRTLRVADNPSPSQASTAQSTPNDYVAYAAKIAAQIGSTATVASGATAHDLLNEMLAGNSLIYRSAYAVPQYGLPNGGEQNVGQLTASGLHAYPLDKSFRASLTECGIDSEATQR